MIVTALVLAAGSSRRLGQPKQLLPFREATLLDATIEAVIGFGFAQTIVRSRSSVTYGLGDLSSRLLKSRVTWHPSWQA